MPSTRVVFINTLEHRFSTVFSYQPLPLEIVILLIKGLWISQVAGGKDSTCQCRRLRKCGKDPLEEEVATHSSTLAWEIPWTEEPGGLQTVHGGGKESDTAENAHACMHEGATNRASFFIYIL